MTWAEKPLQETFPGAVHSRLTCPVCGVLWIAHKVARRGGRRHYLWSVKPTGEVSICTPDMVGVIPPPRRP